LQVAFYGWNQGRSADENAWTPDQKSDLSVWVDGVACPYPGRVAVAGSQYGIQCTLPYLPVGLKNVTLRVAGQYGFVNSSDTGAVLVVCR
jgi:hypothetical protein